MVVTEVTEIREFKTSKRNPVFMPAYACKSCKLKNGMHKVHTGHAPVMCAKHMEVWRQDVQSIKEPEIRVQLLDLARHLGRIPCVEEMAVEYGPDVSRILEDKYMHFLSG